MGYSILVTAYNEEKTLHLCLEAINKQTIQPEVKVVVDDVSTDRTPEIGESYGFHVYSKPPPKEKEAYSNRCKAFNTGINVLYAQGGPLDYILKVDADIVIPPNYAEKLLEIMDDPKIGVSSGVSEAYINKRFISNGAVLYRVVKPVQYAPVKYAWDRAVTINIMKRGYGFKVATDLVYSELRPPRIKAPPIWRVIKNRIELKYLSLKRQ